MSNIIVDVEADGPCPGLYSMVSFGAVILSEDLDKTFYGQCRPLADAGMPEQLQASDDSENHQDHVKQFAPNNNHEEESKEDLKAGQDRRRAAYFALLEQTEIPTPLGVPLGMVWICDKRDGPRIEAIDSEAGRRHFLSDVPPAPPDSINTGDTSTKRMKLRHNKMPTTTRMAQPRRP